MSAGYEGFGDPASRLVHAQETIQELTTALRDLQKAFRDCIGSAAFWDFEQSNPAVRAAQRALARVDA